MKANGNGKMWYNDGDIFIGKWNHGKRVEGKLYELQADKTHTLFEVKYDEEERVSTEKEISSGHKLV
jgi:hypothetical protein